MPFCDRLNPDDTTAPVLSLSLCSDTICRVSIAPQEGHPAGLLNRYGFVNELQLPPEQLTTTPLPDGVRLQTPHICVTWNRRSKRLTISGADGCSRLTQVEAYLTPAGSRVRFAANPEEDWVGFGDQTRERLYHRGHVADCHVRNVRSYAPVPFFMSTGGVGVLVNTTQRIVFDMCASDPDVLEWRDGCPLVDYYVFVGDSFRQLLDSYTQLTGRPRLPPQWAFGLWYICRTQANDYEVVNDACQFRREGIPCDVIGLEPGWMETNYDGSLNKTWSQERFPIPRYAPKGPHNFFNALQRMGFHMELWLCCDYDLTYEAERRCGNPTPTRTPENQDSFFHPDAEQDPHFSSPRYLDALTRPEEPWFEHLKAFVDQGADFFKQDGAFQVLDHPDRTWGNGLSDREVHNLYPLLYARQMVEGFEAYTGRRGLSFTPCGWTGFQAWAGTWTGDTGGGPHTLTAMLNTALVGHSWATNDMEVTQLQALHFGYLLPWAQINSWNYFRMPWLQGAALLAAHRTYSRLRARLIPYLYSWAFHATQTGFPLIVPLTLEFPHDPACRSIIMQYLLGRDIMVAAFTEEVYFPEGAWWDMWSGAIRHGGRAQRVDWPADRGGGLYLREGGIVPFGPVMNYRGERPVDAIELLVFPGNTPSEFCLYEDDGTSLDYRQGAAAHTRITTHNTAAGLALEIAATEGTYAGMPTQRTWSARMVTRAPVLRVRLEGQILPAEQWKMEAETGTVLVTGLAAPCRLQVECAG